ncbi:MAG TPA: hypothetical protein V6D25_29925, partial [Leptolyngbyaceae cyanobacterium]
ETELVLRPAQAPWKGGACTRVPLRTRVGRKGLLPLLPAPFPPASSGQSSAVNVNKCKSIFVSGQTKNQGFEQGCSYSKPLHPVSTDKLGAELTKEEGS